jgi:hypothetical protein
MAKISNRPSRDFEFATKYFVAQLSTNSSWFYTFINLFRTAERAYCSTTTHSSHSVMFLSLLTNSPYTIFHDTSQAATSYIRLRGLHDSKLSFEGHVLLLHTTIEILVNNSTAFEQTMHDSICHSRRHRPTCLAQLPPPSRLEVYRENQG